MRVFKKLLSFVLLGCTLFSLVGCGKVGGFITNEYINGERVSGQAEWKAACKKMQQDIKTQAFEMQVEGVFNVSLFNAKGAFKAVSNGAPQDGISAIELTTEEKFPLKSKNENEALVMYQDKNNMQISYEKDGKRVGYKGKEHLENFLQGEYGTCYASYLLANTLMYEVLEYSYEYFSYDASSRAYVLDEKAITQEDLDKSGYEIELKEFDFKVWICDGKVEKIIFEAEAQSNEFLKGIMVEASAVGQFKWLD